MVLVETRRKGPDPGEGCAGQALTQLPRAASPGAHTLVEFPPLECGQHCDLFLTNRIWQREWDVTSMITL